MRSLRAAALQQSYEGGEDKDGTRSEAWYHLLQSCGISEETAFKHPEKITSIEMVLDDYNCMRTLCHFPKLRNVCLIQQALSKIEGLEGCVELEIGSGLAGLVSLETLWIAENQLTSLDGLAHAAALTEVNAARNKLSSAIGAFEFNPKLTDINLADNNIGSFREVLSLTRHADLRVLCFSDPDWGENPICQLCNYQTYTLYHLPNLEILDQMRLREEEHLVAKTAFAKKSLFYNMRIKTVRRQAVDGLRMAKELDEARVAMLQKDLEPVARVLKRLTSAFQARRFNPPGAQPSPLEAGEGVDLGPLERKLKETKQELVDAAMMWGVVMERANEEAEKAKTALLMELQTGGNVRLEEGAEKEGWFKHIQELVQSRFRAAEFSRFGISGVKVTGVTRVHNQCLRIGFEDMLQDLELEPQKQLEYLFYVPDPRQGMDNIRVVIEEGFRPETEKELGGSAAAANWRLGPHLMTNSLGVVEGCRLELVSGSEVGQAFQRCIQRAARQEKTDLGRLASRPPAVWGGTMLVCSAFLVNQMADSPATFNHQGDVREQWLQQQHHQSPSKRTDEQMDMSPKRDRSPKGACRSVFRTCDGDAKQKVWSIGQTDAVLPEFLVNFEYVYSWDLLQSQAQPCKPELGPLGSLFRDYAVFARFGMPKEEKPAQGASAAAGGGAASPQSSEGDARPGMPSMPDLPDLKVVEVLDLTALTSKEIRILPSPEPKALPKMQVLSLHGRNIRRIEPSVADTLRELQVLLLSFNAIESLSWLNSWPSLTQLDLSFNLVQTVNNVAGASKLKNLDLGWNCLLEVETLEVFERDLPDLENLNLAGNPCARTNGYRMNVLARLRHLLTLDEEEVRHTEVEEAKSRAPQSATLTEAMMKDNSIATAAGVKAAMTGMPIAVPQFNTQGAMGSLFETTEERWRISKLLTLEAHHSSGQNKSMPKLTKSRWREAVEIMDLRGCGLSELCDMKGLLSLRRLQLCRNRLTSLDKVAFCASLEELSAEENQLTSLQGVSSLLHLRRLDVARNKLTQVMELGKLPRLCQLSLEDNYVDSLDTFVMLRSLMELYLSNNLIEELRSVLMLKQLPKLIVLDLSGNELCSATDYRAYTVFHLRRLKVLDGQPVTPADHQEAEEKFTGRVTMELIEEKLGPSPACYSNRSVDFSGQGLRDLGQLINDEMFPSLRELNLDSNPIQDVRGLGPLSKLLVLRMNKSRLDMEKGIVGEGENHGGLNSMPHIQVLEIGNSGISDVSYFSKLSLSTLRILHLQGNELTKLEGLSAMEQLRELVLDRNKIKQFDEHSFEGLRALRELRVEDNGLKSLEHIAPLPRLRALYLSSNRIGELTELEKLRHLRHVVTVSLQQNPCARKPHYRLHVINALPSARAVDSKEVTEDERARMEQLLMGGDPSRLAGQGVHMLIGDPNVLPSQLAGANLQGDQAPQGPPDVAAVRKSIVGGNAMLLMGQDLGDQMEGHQMRAVGGPMMPKRHTLAGSGAPGGGIEHRRHSSGR
eukprot:TRINITY_DN30882_c0_g2_i1.p1 TRINITY_DN30882_c0_g2~~TRINITY_DN30882_c0_g2_i1.p1  ORF type:complete len:1502 (-),score=435.63 TRINITY_DN30882_c0_g2_i1:512-5017(-)